MPEIMLNSENAKLFKAKYEHELTKPYTTEPLTEGFGQLEETDTHFIIRLNNSLPPDACDANFCHELFHAVQISRGFPHFEHSTVISEPERSFLSFIRSTVFDMSVNDTLRAEHLNSSYFFDLHCRYLQSLCDKGYKEILNQPQPLIQPSKDILALKLTLAYSHSPSVKTALFKKRIDRDMPDVSMCVSDLQQIILRNGYKTAEQTFFFIR
jgi:hypothetical protein